MVPRLNEVIRAFEGAKLPILLTRDWHPPNHISFKARGGPWPPHCVRGTKGAEFHPDLTIPQDATIISKGDRPDAEAYSGFQGTNLGAQLLARGVKEIIIGGLTTDYCVRESTLDALKLGLRVEVLKDCIRGVDVHPGDSERALAEIVEKGAKLATSTEAIRLAAGA